MEIKETVRRLHLELAEKRGLHATYCPSEVARKTDSDNWREMMNLVREVADELTQEGALVVMQKGNVIAESTADAVGPIRLRKKT